MEGFEPPTTWFVVPILVLNKRFTTQTLKDGGLPHRTTGMELKRHNNQVYFRKLLVWKTATTRRTTMKQIIILLVSLLIYAPAKANKLNCGIVTQYCQFSNAADCKTAKMSAETYAEYDEFYHKFCQVDKALYMAAITAFLLSEETCYLYEDRMDAEGNWSGVKTEVKCK